MEKRATSKIYAQRIKGGTLVQKIEAKVEGEIIRGVGVADQEKEEAQ